MEFNVGSYRNQNDINLKLQKYKELLALQSKLQEIQEQKNKQAFKGGVPVIQQPTSIGRYASAEEELRDMNAQQQKMLMTLGRIFKYPRDAKIAMDLFLSQGYSPADFNQLEGDFLQQIKNQLPTMTPQFFISNWDRFQTKYQSQGDSLVSIGIMDDRARYFMQQDANKITKFMKQYGGLNPRQLARLNRELENIVFTGGDKPDVFKRFTMDIDFINKGIKAEERDRPMSPEEKKAFAEESAMASTKSVNETVKSIITAFNLGVPVSAKEKLRGARKKIVESYSKESESVAGRLLEKELEKLNKRKDILEKDLKSVKEKGGEGGVELTTKIRKNIANMEDSINTLGVIIHKRLKDYLEERKEEVPEQGSEKYMEILQSIPGLKKLYDTFEKESEFLIRYKDQASKGLQSSRQKAIQRPLEKTKRKISQREQMLKSIKTPKIERPRVKVEEKDEPFYMSKRPSEIEIPPLEIVTPKKGGAVRKRKNKKK